MSETTPSSQPEETGEVRPFSGDSTPSPSENAESTATPAPVEAEEEFVVVDAKTAETEVLKAAIVAIMKTVFDPEIPVNIYELGMVYDVFVDEDDRSLVRMTLTSPNCPVAGTLPGEVEAKLNSVEGVSEGKVVLVWDPPWSPDFMSEAAKLELNMM